MIIFALFFSVNQLVSFIGVTEKWITKKVKDGDNIGLVQVMAHLWQSGIGSRLQTKRLNRSDRVAENLWTAAP